MLYKGPDPKCGIKINGKDALDYHPEDVKALINSDETGIIRAMFEQKLIEGAEENGVILTDDYAKHAGRPSLTELPFMRSENDGYPFIPGHSPLCNGKPYATAGGKNMVCKCEYDTWNHAGGSVREIWPGMDIDDFDM
jgi:hypothetical protein